MTNIRKEKDEQTLLATRLAEQNAALERARLQMELLAIKSGRLRDARAAMTQKTAKG